MTGGRTIGALLTALLVVFAAGTAAQAPDPALAARLERLRALRLERPADGLLAYYQALTHAALGQHDAALAELRALRGRRLGIVPQGGFEAMQGSPDFRAVRAQLAADEPATPEAPVMHTLRDARLVPEGIAYDAGRGRYFVGSIAQRKIVAIDGRGRVRDFSRRSDALDAVLGLAVDAARGALWAVSTNGFLDEASRQRRNAVMQYELASGRLVARHEVPEALQLNDVAVAADGTLYATDSAGGSVLQSHHHPLFDEPTTGGIAGEKLVVIANSHVGSYRPDGTIERPEALSPPSLLAVPLR